MAHPADTEEAHTLGLLLFTQLTLEDKDNFGLVAMDLLQKPDKVWDGIFIIYTL